MKKMMMMAVLMTIVVAAKGMTFTEARNEALFLSDKMAYELNLSSAQYEDVYEINLDYMMSVSNHSDVFGIYWERRNSDLRFVLTSWQYDRYMATAYFFRPLTWEKSHWVFGIYRHYASGRMFNAHPKVFVSYRGGNNRLNSSHYANRHATNRVVKVNHVTVHNNRPVAVVGKTTTISNGRRTGMINSAPAREMNNRTASVTRTVTAKNNSGRTGTTTHGNFGGRR